MRLSLPQENPDVLTPTGGMPLGLPEPPTVRLPGQVSLPQTPAEGPSIDLTPPKPLYDDLTPGLAYLKDHVAGLAKNRSMRDWAFSSENIGKTVEELQKQREEEHAARTALQLSNETAHLSDEEYQKVLGQAEAHIKGAPAIPEEAPLEAPNAMQTGLGALFAVADPRHAFDAMAAPYASQLGERERRAAEAQTRWKQEMEVWKTKLGAIQDLSQTQTQRDIEKARLENEAFDRASREKIAADALKERELISHENDVNRLSTMFYNAKNGAAARVAGKRLQATDKVAPPTDQEIEAHAQATDSDQVATALKDWRSERQLLLNTFGEIDDQRAPEAEATRQAIARQYAAGDDALYQRILGVLPEAPTGETLRKQQFDRHKEEFEKNLAFMAQKERDSLADKKARLEIARAHLATAQRNSDTSAGNLAMREREYAARLLRDEASPKLEEANAKHAGAVAAAVHARESLAGAQAQLKAAQQRKNEKGALGLVDAANKAIAAAQAEITKQDGEAAKWQGTAKYLESIMPTADEIAEKVKAAEESANSGYEPVNPGAGLHGQISVRPDASGKVRRSTPKGSPKVGSSGSNWGKPRK